MKKLGSEVGLEGSDFLLLTLLTLSTLLLQSCATPTPKRAKSEYNFSQVKRVALGKFEGQGGDAVAHEFVRQLVASGFVVTDQKQNADVLLSGTVSDYRPSNKMLVFIGTGKFPGPKEQPIEVTNPIVNSASPTDLSALGLPKIQMVAVSASVGVEAQLTDLKTGATLWSHSDSYEGLTMPGAIQTTTTTLVRSLRALIPVTPGHA